jgi:tetratricopeptide (TPR) repeat protein
LYKEAVAPLESEIKANPTNTQARWLLGLSYFNTGEYSKAAELLHDVPSSGSTNVELWYAFASSLIKQQKFDAAQQAIEQMAVLTGTTPRLHALRGQLQYATGNIEGAISNLETAVKLEPENADFHYELSRAYMAAGRREEGKREKDAFDKLKKQIPQ